ncbi:hypoxic response protein 1 [Streptomyces spiroverticillatus]|uniref:Hypoxic response protein 1 n=1 Tax=Streptomyces finlayi TaxID=67296 RepID=A0A918X5Q8_9ACTN|nr:CBS domain-containing protein [Streptomyces finlayi]GHA39347.1 hypoxic response protein 1 [Streptomyces spiroverticillatus]GHD14227.1 hypoxic response protein 1 [Streptomyces finlayi]
MTTVRDLMTPDVRSIPATETLDRAAQLMREHHIGALPVQGSDGALTGIVTDRDIVVKCIAAGHDPSKKTAGDLAEGAPVSVDVSADADEAVRVMSDARIRRLLVLENGSPVGMVTEADLARALPADQLVTFVSAVYAGR